MVFYSPAILLGWRSKKGRCSGGVSTWGVLLLSYFQVSPEMSKSNFVCHMHRIQQKDFTVKCLTNSAVQEENIYQVG
jgi:hypothetical protein